MSNMKRKLIADTQQLDINSKIEFFNFMVSLGISYMENTNGVFFSMADLSDEHLEKMFQKLEILKRFEKDNSYIPVNSTTTNNNFTTEYLFEKLKNTRSSSNNNDDDDELCIEKTDESIHQVEENVEEASYNDGVLYKDIDESIVKDMISRYAKQSKKNVIYAKYALAKKKYNKGNNVESKKFDNFDLNELTKENYIL